jgi:DNA-binding transcriptional ArsR family regulator
VNALAALADPTRRRIVELLAAQPQTELSADELAAHFDTSRPGVSRHLRVLRELGLVSARGRRLRAGPRGRRRDHRTAHRPGLRQAALHGLRSRGHAWAIAQPIRAVEPEQRGARAR